VSIVVTAPTGNIGRVVTERLLEEGEKPILIARNAEKVKDYAERGARVVQGTHEGALFRSFAEAAAQAIHTNDIPHVVHLSSVGAELESGNGPIAGLYIAERVLAEAATNLIQLRPGYFMENTLAQVPNILQASSLFTTFPPDTRFPMIATRDIGARAAKLLRRRDWTGQRVVELQGSGETSYEEAATILSEELGREINHVTVSREQLLESLTAMGLSNVMAESLHEITDGIVEGRLTFHEPRSAENTTPTTYSDFARDVFKPAMLAAASA
jgi:uncharacterized protein YbjT (DUF2867 family)